MEELGVPHYDELIVVANSERIEVRHKATMHEDGTDLGVVGPTTNMRYLTGYGKGSCLLVSGSSRPNSSRVRPFGWR
jgi:hypothetical protein